MAHTTWSNRSTLATHRWRLESSLGILPGILPSSNPTWKVSLASALTKLAAAESAGGAALTFNATSPGRASVVINPENEVSFTISDASGRTVMSGKMDNFTGTANNLLTWSCQAHDTVTNVAGFGNCLESRSIDALGKMTKTLTDGAGRTLRSIDQLGNTTVFTYDAAGNQLSVRDPNNVGQDVVYDSLGRAGLTTDTASHTTNSTYDKAGNKIAAIDGKNQTTSYKFDARGRQKSQTDRIAGVTSYTYLPSGQLASLTDAENQTTSYTYDDAGGKLTEQYPDHVAGSTVGQTGYGVVTFVYDAAGRVSRKQDQKGDTCTFNYDLAGRLSNRQYRTAANSPSGTIADSDQFSYDRAGRMLTAFSGRYNNTVGYSHDSAGRKKTESLTISGQTYTTQTGYNARGELTQYTYPDGTVVGRSYTNRGELNQLTHAGTTIDTRVYDNGGRQTSSTFNNGVAETRVYGTDNTLTSISFGGSGTAIGNMTYAWDNNHNKTSETITGTMSNYGFTIPTNGYDNEDRLVSFNRTSGLTQSWNLSAVGDWNSVTTNGTAQTRTHGPTHELLTGAGQNVSTDVNGNIAAIPAALRPNASSLTSTWDFDNRMISADVGSNGSVEVSHQYDALGRRVARTAAGSTTIFVQAGQQTIADYVAGAAPAASTYRYIYASYFDEPVMRWQTSSSTSLYYHRNQQYSVTAVTNSAGAVQERYAYSAYGVPTIANASGTVLTSSAISNRYMYTGREWDNDIQQYHYRARMYDASLGRFCSRDPIGYFDGNSMYFARTYVDQVDPFGLSGEKVCGKISRKIRIKEIDRKEGFTNWVGKEPKYWKKEWIHHSNVGEAHLIGCAIVSDCCPNKGLEKPRGNANGFNGWKDKSPFWFSWETEVTFGDVYVEGGDCSDCVTFEQSSFWYVHDGSVEVGGSAGYGVISGGISKVWPVSGKPLFGGTLTLTLKVCKDGSSTSSATFSPTVPYQITNVYKQGIYWIHKSDIWSMFIE